MKSRVMAVLMLLIFLPNCIFQKSSRQYDCARAAYENVLYKYERELALLVKIQTSNDREEKLSFGHDLADEILLKNEEYNNEHSSFFARKNEVANYPFTQYKKDLDCHISLLEKTKSKLYWKQEGLGKSFQDLINNLDQLRRYIVLCPEYSQERRMLERRKILEVEQKEQTKKPIKTKK